MARRPAKGWCIWGDRPCAATCPVDAIDNHGQPYKACPGFRLKSQAEIDAMSAPHKSEPQGEKR